MGIRAYYVNGLSNDSSDKSGKGDPVAPVAPADNVLMHAIYYSDLNAATGQWSTRKPIYLENLIDGNMVDPNLVQLQDGRYLMTYMRGNFGQANPEAMSTIYSAWSYDGVYFFDPQVVFKPAGSGNADGSPVVTDPSLVQLRDGSWLLAVSNPSGPRATLYTSADGRSFAPNGVTLPTFSPDLQVLADGRVRLHYADGPSGGIGSRISADGGLTWTVEAGARKSGAGFDPSVFQLADGSWRMLFKTQTPNSDPSASPILGHKTSLATSTDGASFSTAQSEFAASASVGEGIDFTPLTVTQSLLTAAATNDQIAVGSTGAHVRAGAGRDTVVFATTADKLTLRADFLNAGDWVAELKAARILGAVFGATAVRNPEYVGIGIDLLDGGMSYAELAGQAMAAAGKTTPAAVCAQLWLNLTGTVATAGDIAPFVAMLEKGELSVGALTAMAADNAMNATNIDLVGLAQTGLEFL